MARHPVVLVQGYRARYTIAGHMRDWLRGQMYPKIDLTPLLSHKEEVKKAWSSQIDIMSCLTKPLYP